MPSPTPSGDERLRKAIERYQKSLNSGEQSSTERLRHHQELMEVLAEVVGTERRDLDLDPVTADPGQMIGDFLIIRKIGQGGMGTVYEAKQVELGRRVALKVLPGAMAADDESVERFKREAKMIAQHRIPGVVQIYGTGQHGHMHFLAMEMIYGAPLREILDEASEAEDAWTGQDVMFAISTFMHRHLISPKSPPADGYLEEANAEQTFRDTWSGTVAAMASQVATSLHAIHAVSVVHRDVKPDNIMIREDGKTMLTDFGLALLEGSTRLTMTGAFAGSPSYSAPEQVGSRRLKVDHRADVFSLGITLYEMLTFKNPFEADSVAATVQRIISLHPDSPHEINPAIPSDLGSIVMKALEKHPGRRYRTAKAMAEDLDRFLSDQPVLARPAPRIDKIRRWSSADPRAAILIAALILVMLASIGTSIWLAMNSYDRQVALTELQSTHEATTHGAAKLREELHDLRQNGTVESRAIASERNVLEASLRKFEARHIASSWRLARIGIASSRRYGGLDIKALPDFTPLGEDPETGLWEFVHHVSGEEPSVGADKSFAIDASTGLIFVLLPGGEFSLGARGEDKGVQQDERPQVRIALSPFLICKHEITQQQWFRITGKNPSEHDLLYIDGKDKAAIRHPVENLTWTEASRVMHQLGLDLPTEAQWEYACRASTTTAWNTGSGEASVRENANLMSNGTAADGYQLHATVGSFRPNAFGLYDMHGNVSEYCADVYGPYLLEAFTPGDGLRVSESDQPRVHRGGSYSSSPSHARSGSRGRCSKEMRSPSIGVRPVRAVSAR